MSGSVRRVRAPALLLLAAVLALGGCASQQAPDPAASPPPPAPQQPPPEPPPRPQVGQCHRLSLDEAAAPVDTGEAARCGRRTTSVTVAVRPLDLVADGHLLAPTAPAAASRLEQSCPPGLVTRWAGGEEEARRLSRLQVVWFAPTPEELEAGADWVRCDLVAVANDQRLATLPAQTRGLLEGRAADDVALCGTTAPGARRFERVACALPHRWRAVGTHDLAEDARYLGRSAAAELDAACEDQAAERAPGALELSWALEWPTRAQWDAGQRWGWCWVPETG